MLARVIPRGGSCMTDRYFVDTNVLVYARDASAWSPGSERAKSLF